MGIWLFLLPMTAAAVLAVLWPLVRRRPARGGSDIEVYRDQLDEIGRDRAVGLIGEAEADAAQVEVSRRLIAAADAARTQDRTAAASPFARRLSAMAGLILLPVGALALYLALGSPQLASDAAVARRSVADEAHSVAAMVAKVEAHVTANPQDGRGWEVLGPVYMRLGRFGDAVRAWQMSIGINGATAPRLADLGEALTASANGIVTTEAKAAFDQALALDPQDVMSRFYVGMAADQDNRRADADKIWRDLLASAPPGAPWIEVVQRAMARNAPPVAAAATPPVPGPSAADVAAAQGMTQDEQSQMIGGMVARLAERLKTNGDDVAGWQRLLRAYVVLGDRAKASAAAADARRALAGDPAKLRQIEDAVKELGLKG
ncbi:MAG TPA: c-type cytochrome biogenesis protein CcmI [Rhizomicrobium sp.]